MKINSLLDHYKDQDEDSSDIEDEMIVDLNKVKTQGCKPDGVLQL
jgi:hypothetical protein